MTLGATLRPVSAGDRAITLVLIIAAMVAWLVVAVVFTALSPVGDAGAQLFGAIALGAAVGLTLWPLLWSAQRRRDDDAAGLATSARRSGLVGLVVSILVVLRALDAVGLTVLIFLVVTAVLVEVAFSLRR
jgi:hypothetical protein